MYPGGKKERDKQKEERKKKGKRKWKKRVILVCYPKREGKTDGRLFAKNFFVSRRKEKVPAN